MVGEATISVADIDLIYLGLQIVLTSIETARRSAAGARGASVVWGPEMAPHTPQRSEAPRGIRGAPRFSDTLLAGEATDEAR